MLCLYADLISYRRGREVEEVSCKGPKIGGFASHDYFGDGSFYLLDTPGVSIRPKIAWVVNAALTIVTTALRRPLGRICACDAFDRVEPRHLHLHGR
jgi:hypothetical protein